MTYNLGYKWVYSRDAGYTETTFLPDMIKMKSSGVKMVLEITEGPTEISSMAQEMKQQGLNVPLVTGAGTYSKAFDPGSAGNGTLLFTSTALYMGEDAKVIPAVGTFDKWAKKADPQTALDLFTLDGWINAQLFVQALKNAGTDPTRASLVAQLNKVDSFNASGLITPRTRPRRSPVSVGSSPSTTMESGCVRARSQVGVRLQSQGLLPGQLQGHPPLSSDGRARVEEP